MPVYTDQLGRMLELKQFPQRIVSLVPSQTELLYDLGLDQQVVGITKFCVHPRQWFQSKTRVGGTKQLHIEKIKALQPDLIIANKEENTQTEIEELAREFLVWVSDVSDLASALQMIESIGQITGTSSIAITIVQGIRQAFASLEKNLAPLPCAYLIWKDPYMAAGGNTFVNDMLARCGFANVFASQQRYPEISVDALKHADCRLVLLSSEPFPFKQKHAEELQLLLPSTKIILVDGEMFSRYGSRLLQAPSYFTDVQNQVLSLVYGAGAE